MTQNESTNSGQVWPDLMTEDEVIRYLRIPEVSKSGNYANVIQHLKRMRDLPCSGRANGEMPFK